MKLPDEPIMPLHEKAIAQLTSLIFTKAFPPITLLLVVQVALESYKATITIPNGTEGYWVEQLVRSHIIQHWEFQDEPEHLRTIRDRLLFDEHKAGKLLNIYQRVLQVEELRNRNAIENLIPVDNSEEQTQLLLSGLVKNSNGYLRVKNPIYRSVFTPQWVLRQLENLPFSS